MFASLNSNTTVVTCGAGTASHSEHPSSPPVISGVRVARSLVFCVMFCRSLFVIVLSVLLLFIASDYLPLVSSNSYYISISYCKDNIKCDSASTAPRCSLFNDVSIDQKLLVKFSNTSTMIFPPVVKTLSKCLRV